MCIRDRINNTLLRSQSSYNVWGNMSRDYYFGYWRIDRPSNVYPAPRVGSAYANGDGTDANLQDGKYPVSYTHLDVYKRQGRRVSTRPSCSAMPKFLRVWP